MSDCPPCICDSNTMQNTLFGLTGLASVIICRVFWGAIKRNVNLLWKKITDAENPDAEGAQDGREDVVETNWLSKCVSKYPDAHLF